MNDKKKPDTDNKKPDYFDITKLLAVMDANGWTEGKNYMKFWSEGAAKTALIDPNKAKSTIGMNVDKGLRIYNIPWNWIEKFKSPKAKYSELFSRLDSPAVKRLLTNKYGKFSSPKLISPINAWLTDGMDPKLYLRHIKDHQLQYIAVAPFDDNGGKFDDLVAALNGFNFFAFYKGMVISASVFRTAQEKAKNNPQKQSFPAPNKKIKDPLDSIPEMDRKKIVAHLKDPRVVNVVYVTHVGVYAGDIYEFNGKQYLATWNLKDKTVELSRWDAAWGTSDTDDETDLAITNETFQIYRKKANKGGDFLALSPIKLTAYSLIIPVK
jgi:hypothetical protein